MALKEAWCAPAFPSHGLFHSKIVGGISRELSFILPFAVTQQGWTSHYWFKPEPTLKRCQVHTSMRCEGNLCSTRDNFPPLADFAFLLQTPSALIQQQLRFAVSQRACLFREYYIFSTFFLAFFTPIIFLRVLQSSDSNLIKESPTIKQNGCTTCIKMEVYTLLAPNIVRLYHKTMWTFQ